jgi:hypothetical protein
MHPRGTHQGPDAPGGRCWVRPIMAPAPPLKRDRSPPCRPTQGLAPLSWPLIVLLSLLSAIVPSFGVLTTNDRFPSIVPFCFFAALCGVVVFVWIANLNILFAWFFNSLSSPGSLVTPLSVATPSTPRHFTTSTFRFARWRQLDQLFSLYNLLDTSRNTTITQHALLPVPQARGCDHGCHCCHCSQGPEYR